MAQFSPNAGDRIRIVDANHSFTEHPALRGSGFAYGQTGRAGTVYQLADDRGQYHALKVFTPRYRQPSLVSLSDNLRPFATLPGLAVCDRGVLTSRRHGELLRLHPELLYAVLMPWVKGQTWLDIIQQQTPLTSEQCLNLAHTFVDILVTFEQKGIAHGDLSGSNILIDGLGTNRIAVELVDVEQLYAPGLIRPAEMPGGSPGYAHHRAGTGFWQDTMDRFAGAVLLVEMLGWCDERLRAAAWGETYFAEDELQVESERYRTARAVLETRWGRDAADLLDRAWRSDSLADCPTFGAWQLVLPVAAARAAGTGVQNLPAAAARSVSSPGQAETIDANLAPNPQEKEELLLAVAMATQSSQWGRAAELYQYLLAGWPEDPGRNQWQEGLKRANKRGQDTGQGSGIRRFAPVLVVVALLVMAGIYFTINPPGGDPPATPPPSSTVMVVSGVTATTTATPSRTVRPTATETPVTPSPTVTFTATPSRTPTSTPRSSATPTWTPRPENTAASATQPLSTREIINSTPTPNVSSDSIYYPEAKTSVNLYKAAVGEDGSLHYSSPHRPNAGDRIETPYVLPKGIGVLIYAAIDMKSRIDPYGNCGQFDKCFARMTISKDGNPILEGADLWSSHAWQRGGYLYRFREAGNYSLAIYFCDASYFDCLAGAGWQAFPTVAVTITDQ